MDLTSRPRRPLLVSLAATAAAWAAAIGGVYKAARARFGFCKRVVAHGINTGVLTPLMGFPNRRKSYMYPRS